MIETIKFVDGADRGAVTTLIVISGKVASSLPREVDRALESLPLGTALQLFIPGRGGYIAIKSKGDRKSLEEAGAALWRKANGSSSKTLTLDLTGYGTEGLQILQGILLASWQFDKYRTKQSMEAKQRPDQIDVIADNPELFEKSFHLYSAAIRGVYYARSLTSEPPNRLPPQKYAEKLLELTDLGIEVEIFDLAALRALGMSALLAVGAGSATPPALALMQWRGANAAARPIALVGKGVCFDAGGICLKSAQQQLEMKWDKAAAGVVAGTLKALALAKAEVNVIGVVGLAENMPDGAALKPGDVIDTMAGLTVEIVNSDAEGRLLLADCLSYVQKRFDCGAIVDMGTLTMETFASLGAAYAGLYSNDRNLAKELLQAGAATDEGLWELPMGEYFAKQVASTIADIKNMGVEQWGENGAAAEFLRAFITPGIPWAHIDISGVSWSRDPLPLSDGGVTGFGVRLLLSWLLDRASKNC